MRLSQLFDDATVLRGDPATAIADLTADSREVRPGSLFAALVGARQDGRGFLADALARGAVAVLGDPSLRDLDLAVPMVLADDPRRSLALAAARFHAGQPRLVAAVTGTNGKTSVASFTRQIWSHAGCRAASLGTLGVQTADGLREGSLTTPDPVSLHRELAALAAGGIDHLVLEASSHALDQRRLDGVRLRAAAFTQLSRDHLDYHGDMQRYLAAKARLFDTLLPADGIAVLNADVAEFDALRDAVVRRGGVVLDYGRLAVRLRLEAQTVRPEGQRLAIVLDGRRVEVEIAIFGSFQAHNILAAAGLALATGVAADAVIAALPALASAPGRMSLVGTAPNAASVFVDYAHTPDAIAAVLGAARPHCRARLHVVIGAGGDRDAGKRPLMGAAAHALADRVIVTDDNPRSEDPALIRRAVLAGAPDAVEIGDRQAAIAAGIDALGPGDVLIIAGKGHERGQTVGDRVLPFDDSEVAREILRGVGGRCR